MTRQLAVVQKTVGNMTGSMRYIPSQCRANLAAQGINAFLSEYWVIPTDALVPAADAHE
jgi:hypothetical protein